MLFLRGELPRCGGQVDVYAERRCRHSRMLNEGSSVVVLRQIGDRRVLRGAGSLRWVTRAAPARNTHGDDVPG
jgi:hypothetical protein